MVVTREVCDEEAAGSNLPERPPDVTLAFVEEPGSDRWLCTVMVFTNSSRFAPFEWEEKKRKRSRLADFENVSQTQGSSR